ncbi:phosphate acyltransferase PlsX [Peptoniphilus sp. KCTC 25270]|uniref:phosphate acyltransferase PlsX n=1 Tax=Peptoniphilus sp. KCTC 25270 TaxID=2897414 RepID=UPI001E4BB31F|nr:phosphate acyltransferase PlsX [Peptoniphilus sp. KCTC 25270]MCD1147071.1 phosphate acyltransferase PlsX [Peptoniphilus sp. KCTC 25270]
MKLLFDCAGGDHAPEAIIEGAYLAKEKLGITPYFVGNSEILRPLIQKEEENHIFEATEVIENTDDPAVSIRRKPNSSTVVGLKALASGEVDGFLSAGSTGALLAGGLFIVKRLDGVKRAALPVLLPNKNGKTLVLDSGANMDTDPELLVSFAEMGKAYLENVLGIDNPRIGLLNVGTEEGKGDKRAQETFQLLKESDWNFIGNVEGRDIFSGNVDVVIADGFSGNIALKTAEGVVEYLLGAMQKNMAKADLAPEVMLQIKTLLGSIFHDLDYNKQGGVPLLGLKKPVVKAHGSSNGEAIYNGAAVLAKMIESNMIEKMSI